MGGIVPQQETTRSVLATLKLMSISLHPDIAKEPAAKAVESTAAERAPRTKIRSRLFTKYVALFVAVVAVALLSNGIFEVFFYYREHKVALIRIQREQAEAAAAKAADYAQNYFQVMHDVHVKKIKLARAA